LNCPPIKSEATGLSGHLSGNDFEGATTWETLARAGHRNPAFLKGEKSEQPFQRAIAADPSGSVQLPADLEI
jgi:hypothetical protein